MKKTFFTNSPGETKKLGKFLAQKIIRRNSCSKSQKSAKILGLEGDLGGGKTTFLQGFAKGLGIKQKILSPTFIIMRRSRIQSPTSKYQNFYHIDCYRIKKPEEILDLRFKEIISNPNNIIAIEWIDKIKRIIPKKITWLTFKFINKNKRKIVIKNDN